MTTITHDSVCADQIRGIAGIAVRLGRRLEAWGVRAAEPMDREALRQRHELEREARAAILARGDAHTGLHQLLR